MIAWSGTIVEIGGEYSRTEVNSAEQAILAYPNMPASMQGGVPFRGSAEHYFHDR